MTSGDFLKIFYGQNDKYNSLYCLCNCGCNALLFRFAFRREFLVACFEKFMVGHFILSVNFGGYPPICMTLFLGELMTWKNF